MKKILVLNILMILTSTAALARCYPLEVPLYYFGGKKLCAPATYFCRFISDGFLGTVETTRFVLNDFDSPEQNVAHFAVKEIPSGVRSPLVRTYQSIEQAGGGSICTSMSEPAAPVPQGLQVTVEETYSGSNLYRIYENTSYHR